MNEAMNAPMKPEMASFAVGAIRKEYERETVNAEDHAKALSHHIRAIDEEIDALNEERGRLSDSLFKATEVMVQESEKFRAVATNEYRTNGSAPALSRY